MAFLRALVSLGAVGFVIMLVVPPGCSAEKSRFSAALLRASFHAGAVSASGLAGDFGGIEVAGGGFQLLRLSGGADRGWGGGNEMRGDTGGRGGGSDNPRFSPPPPRKGASPSPVAALEVLYTLRYCIPRSSVIIIALAVLISSSGIHGATTINQRWQR